HPLLPSFPTRRSSDLRAFLPVRFRPPGRPRPRDADHAAGLNPYKLAASAIRIAAFSGASALPVCAFTALANALRMLCSVVVSPLARAAAASVSLAQSAPAIASLVAYARVSE